MENHPNTVSRTRTVAIFGFYLYCRAHKMRSYTDNTHYRHKRSRHIRDTLHTPTHQRDYIRTTHATHTNTIDTTNTHKTRAVHMFQSHMYIFVFGMRLSCFCECQRKTYKSPNLRTHFHSKGVISNERLTQDHRDHIFTLGSDMQVSRPHSARK